MELKIEYLPINALIPYEKNARKHEDEDLETIISSIQDFGFCDPIGIWSDRNIIVEGHGRMIACKRLGIKTVPCIRLDHLSDEQRRAYALAHNKTAEQSDWYYDIVDEEIAELSDWFDMSDFGFDTKKDPYEEVNEPEEKEHHRDNTFNYYNLYDVDLSRCAGKYQMPIIEPEHHVPTEMISFNYMLNKDEFDKAIHFYIDDYQFERLWTSPHKYMQRLTEFDAVLTPDFSTYTEMPLAMQLWNVFRSRLIGQIMQDSGCVVIPTLQWCREDTFEFCFDGLPENSVVSVSTIGVKKNPESTKGWFAGMDEAMRRLKPEHVIVYGGDIGYDFKDTKVTYITNHNTERMAEIRKEE